MTPNTQTLRAKAQNAVAQALGDAYDCERSWSAWGEGTMSEDDFNLVAEDEDRVSEITNAALEAVEFADILEERDALREELKNLRESIYFATADICSTVNDLERKAA